MSVSESLNVSIVNITGINLQGLNAYNMAICTQPFDGANKEYVQFRFPAFSNIGIGSPFYQSTQSTTLLFRSIPTTIFYP